jgi:hypothetical protein
MSETDETILKAVAAELKARLDDAENEQMPSKIISVLFAVHRSETAASKVREGDDPH